MVASAWPVVFVSETSGAPTGRQEIARGASPWNFRSCRYEPCKGGTEIIDFGVSRPYRALICCCIPPRAYALGYFLAPRWGSGSLCLTPGVPLGLRITVPYSWRPVEAPDHRALLLASRWGSGAPCLRAVGLSVPGSRLVSGQWSGSQPVCRLWFQVSRVFSPAS